MGRRDLGPRRHSAGHEQHHHGKRRWRRRAGRRRWGRGLQGIHARTRRDLLYRHRRQRRQRWERRQWRCDPGDRCLEHVRPGHAGGKAGETIHCIQGGGTNGNAGASGAEGVGGEVFAQSTVTVENSILSGNGAGGNCNGSVSASGHLNLGFGDGTCPAAISGDPKLGSLQPWARLRQRAGRACWTRRQWWCRVRSARTRRRRLPSRSR